MEKMSESYINQIKIEKALELVCPLFKDGLITDAYLVGSIAEGKATNFSDIDINLINPLFEINPSFPVFDLMPEEKYSPNIKKIVDYLKQFGIEFKMIKRKNIDFWYQFYKGELFHIMLTKDEKDTLMPRFQITKELCKWFI